MSLTTMNPATRRLILVTPDEAEKPPKYLIYFSAIILTAESNI